MILGFSDQFVPFVREGSKTHTIRAGSRWKAGMRGDLFEKVRQKGMAIIFRATIVKVDQITIVEPDSSQPDLLIVTIGGERLSTDEAEAFFWRDGFRAGGASSTQQAWLFWRARLPFAGQIIHWELESRFIDGPGSKFTKKRTTPPTVGCVHDWQPFIDPKTGAWQRCRICKLAMDCEGLGD